MSFNFLMQIETASTEAVSPTGVKETSVWEIIDQSNAGIGWIINLLLLLMFAYVIFVFTERLLALRRASKEEANFLSKIKMYLIEGNIDAAKKLCSGSDSPSARMLEKGIDRLGKPIENISLAIENTAKIEIMRLEQRVSFLATASGAGPMLGFLGTVVGMVIVFIDLQNVSSLDIQVIAPGIMTAMITTVEGLIVGIAAFMGYNFLTEKINKIVYTMETTALEFMDVLNEPGK
jgi:biopolymer transport protein ExbB